MTKMKQEHLNDIDNIYNELFKRLKIKVNKKQKPLLFMFRLLKKKNPSHSVYNYKRSGFVNKKVKEKLDILKNLLV